MSDIRNLPETVKPGHLLAGGEQAVCDQAYDLDGARHDCRLRSHAQPKLHLAVIADEAVPWTVR